MLLLFTTNPVFTAVAAWLILGEPMTMWQVVGVGLTCGGVAWVIAERNAGKTDGHVDALGVLCGLGAAGCQAAGVLMSRYAFAHGEMTAPASAWLRIAAGTVVLCVFLPLDRRLGDPGGEDHHHPARPSKARAAVMLGGGMLLGTVLGIGLQQTQNMCEKRSEVTDQRSGTPDTLGHGLTADC
jgi:drug/metabolite transporter (DMT)-like permease